MIHRLGLMQRRCWQRSLKIRQQNPTELVSVEQCLGTTLQCEGGKDVVRRPDNHRDKLGGVVSSVDVYALGERGYGFGLSGLTVLDQGPWASAQRLIKYPY